MSSLLIVLATVVALVIALLAAFTFGIRHGVHEERDRCTDVATSERQYWQNQMDDTMGDETSECIYGSYMASCNILSRIALPYDQFSRPQDQESEY